jgi:hypothetical protein
MSCPPSCRDEISFRRWQRLQTSRRNSISFESSKRGGSAFISTNKLSACSTSDSLIMHDGLILLRPGPSVKRNFSTATVASFFWTDKAQFAGNRDDPLCYKWQRQNTTYRSSENISAQQFAAARLIL